MDALWGPGTEAELAYRREQVERSVARTRTPRRLRWSRRR